MAEKNHGNADSSTRLLEDFPPPYSMAENNQGNADSSTRLLEDFPPPYTESTTSLHVTYDDPRAPLLSDEPTSRYTSRDVVITNQPRQAHGMHDLSPEEAAEISSKQCEAICCACFVYWCCCWLFGSIAIGMAANISGDAAQMRRRLIDSRNVSVTGFIIGLFFLGVYGLLLVTGQVHFPVIKQ